jgi:hypothetical protein
VLAWIEPSPSASIGVGVGIGIGIVPHLLPAHSNSVFKGTRVPLKTGVPPRTSLTSAPPRLCGRTFPPLAAPLRWTPAFHPESGSWSGHRFHGFHRSAGLEWRSSSCQGVHLAAVPRTEPKSPLICVHCALCGELPIRVIRAIRGSDCLFRSRPHHAAGCSRWTPRTCDNLAPQIKALTKLSPPMEARHPVAWSAAVVATNRMILGSGLTIANSQGTVVQSPGFQPVTPPPRRWGGLPSKSGPK